MKIFDPNTWGIVKAVRDITNYRDFIRTMKEERNNPSSKFNTWNLKLNYFYTIYFTYDMDDAESQLPEKIKRLRLIESLAPLHTYLDNELGFAECLVPEISQFYDDKGNPTLTYLVSYRFAFNKLSLWWVLKWTAIIAAATFLFTTYFSEIKTLFNGII
jgi:hypothetical protein